MQFRHKIKGVVTINALLGTILGVMTFMGTTVGVTKYLSDRFGSVETKTIINAQAIESIKSDISEYKSEQRQATQWTMNTLFQLSRSQGLLVPPPPSQESTSTASLSVDHKI